MSIERTAGNIGFRRLKITEESEYNFDRVNSFNYLEVTITSKGEENVEQQNDNKTCGYFWGGKWKLNNDTYLDWTLLDQQSKF